MKEIIYKGEKYEILVDTAGEYFYEKFVKRYLAFMGKKYFEILGI